MSGRCAWAALPHAAAPPASAMTSRRMIRPATWTAGGMKPKAVSPPNKQRPIASGRPPPSQSSDRVAATSSSRRGPTDAGSPRRDYDRRGDGPARSHGGHGARKRWLGLWPIACGALGWNLDLHPSPRAGETHTTPAAGTSATQGRKPRKTMRTRADRRGDTHRGADRRAPDHARGRAGPLPRPPHHDRTRLRAPTRRGGPTSSGGRTAGGTVARVDTGCFTAVRRATLAARRPARWRRRAAGARGCGRTPSPPA